MTQYNSLNVKLSNSRLSKLKSAIRNETDAVLIVLNHYFTYIVTSTCKKQRS